MSFSKGNPFLAIEQLFGKNPVHCTTRHVSLCLLSVLGAYSMDVVASTAFSIDVDSMNNPNDPFIQRIKKLMNFSLFSPLMFLIGTRPLCAIHAERSLFQSLTCSAKALVWKVMLGKDFNLRSCRDTAHLSQLCKRCYWMGLTLYKHSWIGSLDS